jgi:hypothetical protein
LATRRLENPQTIRRNSTTRAVILVRTRHRVERKTLLSGLKTCELFSWVHETYAGEFV